MVRGPCTLPPLYAVTAGAELFETVRGWTRDGLGPVSSFASERRDRTLLIKTPGPWTSVVAFAVLGSGRLRPMLVLKNAVALWAVHRDLPDGRVTPTDWTWLRHLCLLHNPGVEGALSLVDRAVTPLPGPGSVPSMQ